ncbi:3,4-dihydroxy-2-butanone-4-phosphate synthase [Auraticoccus monumenti]|uniref:Multifunctional fusion protein n=1 Tax=Auraticoccus monumenti TaxID=675864 RepID=A0A1G7BTD7_9ACTN|nr:3,4-dihydroxy-2-butanone-4-phosphate synthase [Auraticoccus monumenti]SDE30263.1 3,4-dihydroxy 2-butanone 4-phosphate synthase / GTP cyclohydrolase II [Auraticoccus monumenti]
MSSPTPTGAPARAWTVEEALAALREGRPVLVTDPADREDEGDVVLAGETVSAEWMAWTIRHSSGYVCAPMPAERADALRLPPMVVENADPRRTAYTVTVDARIGVGTGISAADRAHTIRTLAGAATTAEDLTRPGHVVPLRARPGGVLERPGHTEAAVDLCRLAGLQPVAAIAELVDDDGTMLRSPALLRLAAEHDLPVLSIEQLIRWRAVHDRVRRVTETTIPTEHGVFTVVGYRDLLTGVDHLAMISPRGVPDQPLVRLHSECLTGDVLGSQRCDCGSQLSAALARVAAEGGAVVYLRGQEGRGVGLLDKLRAYAVQDQGLDTVDAQTALGLPVDAREYGAGAAILTDLQASSVRLLTNNPLKAEDLRRHGLEISSVEPLLTQPTSANTRYLRTKRDRMGHHLGASVLDTAHHLHGPQPAGPAPISTTSGGAR